MKENKYSHTVEGAAAMRAVGRYETKAIPNPDDLAEKLISTKYQIIVKNPILRKLVLALYNFRLPGIYEAHLCRTHYFDYIIKNELNDGNVEQLLILGAGLDTRAYRFSKFYNRVQFFEVDHPATIEFKQKRLAEAQIDCKHVTFITVDFETENTQDKLILKGFDRSKRTIVLWEGVTMFLDKDTVANMLQFVASLGKKSSILFDYVYPSFYETPHLYKHAKKHLSYVIQSGVSYTFGLDFNEVNNFVTQQGLQLLSNFDAKKMNQQYLSKHKYNVTPWYAIAHCDNNG
ncbi:hypothetical protein MHK_004243 [Candidatus Magnetomorum sp. HK-1]|nr:hypothetical protein MHK_004243 [Candidatus Magnetomorum sp. HK-1]